MQNINNRDPQQTYNIQGSNMIQSAKIENDYSLSHSTFQIESDSFAQSHQCNGCENTAQ
jgi:hypothetical protein